ncbi:hypothetical protein BDK51DRAFT_37810 [Blyttiomyces helicus]|uniref:Tubulin binding cofactor C-like domain-containing protein n=1 Tax=Blyttiomyces helicus TaxID=388810 RepID=A0A4P9W8Y0_9FUNG|nr:hypothetical protein BDK51DRAFT_37810 [Blyttiomyces helicus]|eukprot:RKO88834.1 hypothetical protein BDK51DRAFT_37810 [Blyttiomyces helicus]
MVLVVHPTYISSHDVTLHSVEDCRVYLIGCIRNLTISHCRSTTVILGAASGTVRVVGGTAPATDAVAVASASDGPGITFSGACARFVVDIPGAVRAYLWTRSRPRIVDRGEEGDGAGRPAVVLAPCNRWYRGMGAHAREAGMHPAVNMWDSPLVTTTTTDAAPCWSLLPPTKFVCGEIPFDVALADADEATTDAPAAAVAAESGSGTAAAATPVADPTASPNPLPLPAIYAARVAACELILSRVRAAMEGPQQQQSASVSSSAAQPDSDAVARRAIQARVEAAFKEWMAASGKLRSVAAHLIVGRETGADAEDLEREVVAGNGMCAKQEGESGGGLSVPVASGRAGAGEWTI